MKYLYKISFIVFGVIFWLPCLSQDVWKSINISEFKEEMNQIKMKIASINKFQVETEYLSYENGEKEIVHDRFNGYVKKDGIKLHNYNLGIHSIQNEDMKVVVDSSNELIALVQRDTSSFQIISAELKDVIYEKALSIKKRVVGDDVFYQMKYDKEFDITEYTIQFNKSGQVKMIDLTYSETTKNNANLDVNIRVRILFTHWNLNPQFSKNDFSYKDYIVKNENKYYLTELYRDFELMDQRINAN